MRVALYARVSTKDKGQDTDNQLHQLREYCTRQGWTLYKEYVDTASGKSTKGRNGFATMMQDASKRHFDVVLVWALDRMTRGGVLETFETIKALRDYGVQFESYTEAHFRTTGPAGDLMLAIAAWIAQQERVRISDRVKAGLDRAVRSGKTLGPPKKIIDCKQLLELRAYGLGYDRIAKRMGLPKQTVVRRLKEHEGTSIFNILKKNI